METKLFDSEFKLMNLLWKYEPISAKELSVLAAEAYEWNKNTTYTVIKKLVEKGIIERIDPGFMCFSKLKKEDAVREETKSLINKLFSGSKKAFFASFLEDEDLTEDEIEELQKMIDKKKGTM